VDVRNSLEQAGQGQLIAPKSTFYKFEYVLESGKITGHKPAYDNVTDIKNIRISDLVFGTDVTTPFIIFSNTRHNKINKSKVDSNIHEAKWILRFPNGS